MRCCCCYIDKKYTSSSSVILNFFQKPWSATEGGIWLLFHKKFITCILKIVKHGSKANLKAKSCSDNSELEKSKKLLRMQKVALKRKKLVQVGVVCAQHYSSYKCNKCNCNNTKLNLTTAITPHYSNYTNYRNYIKLHQLQELYQLHQTTPTTTTTKLQKNYSNYTYLHQLPWQKLTGHDMNSSIFVTVIIGHRLFKVYVLLQLHRSTPAGLEPTSRQDTLNLV